MKQGDSSDNSAPGGSISPTSSLIVASHELKSPLVLIRQLSLQIGDLPSENAAASEIARRIQLTSERALRLADNITKTARLEDGLFELEPIILDGVFREVTDEMSPLARALSQKIDVKISRRLPAIVGCRELLHGLLVNLIDNGLQYNEAGESLELSARISRRASKGFVEVAISDHGKTISRNDFARLRDNLNRRAQPISARPLSSGLGLLIASEFSRKMNGHISVVAHRAGGLTFSVLLPASEQLTFMDIAP